jgi:hypothetical protein
LLSIVFIIIFFFIFLRFFLLISKSFSSFYFYVFFFFYYLFHKWSNFLFFQTYDFLIFPIFIVFGKKVPPLNKRCHLLPYNLPSYDTSYSDGVGAKCTNKSIHRR